MKFLSNILSLFILLTLLSCESGNNNQPDLNAVQDIVIVGGDTLGRNWDNLPTEAEAEEAKALGITPEQYLQLKDEMMRQDLERRQAEENALYYGTEVQSTDAGENEFTTTQFSKKMYQEKSYTVETTDGREVVVGSGDKY